MDGDVCQANDLGGNYLNVAATVSHTLRLVQTGVRILTSKLFGEDVEKEVVECVSA
jgi:hypothetical protein